MDNINNKLDQKASTQIGGVKPLTAIRPVCYQYLCRSEKRGAVGPPTVNPKTRWKAQQAALRTAAGIGKILHVLVGGMSSRDL